MDLLWALLRAGGWHLKGPTVYFEHDGQPLPKERARRAKSGGMFTPVKTREAEKSLAWSWKAAGKGLGKVKPEDRLCVVAIFQRASEVRVDGDNLMKLLLDAGTKAQVWTDDSQVRGKALVVEMGSNFPRTCVAFCRLGAPGG